MHTERLQAVMHAAAAAGADAALLSDRASLRWLGADHARHLLVRDDDAVAIAADGAPAPAAPVRVERIDAGEREAVAAALARALAQAGVGPREPVAVEPAQLPSSLVRLLGSDACRDIGDALAGMRARKDDGELAAVARAAALVDAGQRALAAAVRPGATELELWGRAQDAIAAAAGGGEPQTRVELAVGARTALAGAPPGRVAVAPGEPVLVSLACERDGWWAAASLTVACGAPRPALRRLHDAVRDALAAGVRAARPGATTGDVDRAMRERLDRRGLRCPHGTGHAIGRAPQESPLLLPGGETRLAPGTVLALAPGAYAPRLGARLGQTVVVAAGGARPLTATPSDLA